MVAVVVAGGNPLWGDCNANCHMPLQCTVLLEPAHPAGKYVPDPANLDSVSAGQPSAVVDEGSAGRNSCQLITVQASVQHRHTNSRLHQLSSIHRYQTPPRSLPTTKQRNEPRNAGTSTPARGLYSSHQCDTARQTYGA